MADANALDPPRWLRALLILSAVAIAALLLAASFLCLLAINAIPLLFSHRRLSHGSSADG